MKLIKPSEISAKILTLLDESDERVIMVSPYIRISKWYKLINRINALISRRIPIELYIRDDPENTASCQDLDQLSLPYKKIPHLHSKFYLNEKYGIVTSMNLLLSSEFRSLEIGYSTETWNEYNELMDFYYRHIHVGESLYFETVEEMPAVCLKEFMQTIKAKLESNGKNSWTWHRQNILYICTGRNNYIVSIKDGILNISASLQIPSGKVQECMKYRSALAKKVRDLSAMNVRIDSGSSPENILISGQATRMLKSPCITRIMEIEKEGILESLLRLINAIDDIWIQVQPIGARNSQRGSGKKSS